MGEGRGTDTTKKMRGVGWDSWRRCWGRDGLARRTLLTSGTQGAQDRAGDSGSPQEALLWLGQHRAELSVGKGHGVPL